MADLNRLEKLADLKQRGAISDEEFQTLKQQLLSETGEQKSAASTAIPAAKSEEGIFEQSFRGVKRVAIALAALAALFIFAPQLREGASSSCDAVEKIAIRDALKNDRSMGFAAGLQALSGGRIAEVKMKEEQPDYPAAVSCSLAYYNYWINGAPPLR